MCSVSKCSKRIAISNNFTILYSWPGASLILIRGHRHLHECAYIGDDSSEELEELMEIAAENGAILTSSEISVRDSHFVVQTEPNFTEPSLSRIPTIIQRTE